MAEIPENKHLPTSENGLNGLHDEPETEIVRQPDFVPSQLGHRWVSIAALVEQIESAFVEEYGHGSPDLLEADTSSKRLKLVLQTANYVFAVESVQLSPDEKANIISRAYSSLFGYGPLDELFADERVTTISLEGIDNVSVRYGHGELVSLGHVFDGTEQYDRIVMRLVTDAGAEIRPEQPYMEVGLTVGERSICVNLVTPPITIQATADIRVHPAALPTWESLLESGYITEQGLQLVKAIAVSPHGILIIGEPESGKTTLLNLLMNELPDPAQTISVERAGETRLPAGMQRLVAQWPMGDKPAITFGEQIMNALEKQPVSLLLDEVRADEPQTIAPLLSMANPPRQIWSFRGAIFAKRLQNALGMLARRAEPGGGEALIRPLYERLPFVIAVNRVGGQMRLWSIGEWQFKHTPDYPTYVPLMKVEEGYLRFTGEQPLRELTLPPAFWATS
ncbi:MAG: Flp pilus assembly complex ATPase component TadA [Chloroflexi bacterium]|nr:Flp pilus assembly complex ATPase component TadA [Chloroflexota bacterium]MCC6893550.1 Flp pilus assembly complex ATPase component TadA [Anaerolineae bacterium]